MMARTPPTIPAIIGTQCLLEVVLGLISGGGIGAISPGDGRELFFVITVVLPAKQNDFEVDSLWNQKDDGFITKKMMDLCERQ